MTQCTYYRLGCRLIKRGNQSISTFTICGTAEYLSPETLQPARGHRHEVDLWALGVLIYEMLVGSTPFIRDGSHSQMFKAIAAVDYVPPSRAASLAPAPREPVSRSPRD